MLGVGTERDRDSLETLMHGLTGISGHTVASLPHPTLPSMACRSLLGQTHTGSAVSPPASPASTAQPHASWHTRSSPWPLASQLILADEDMAMDVGSIVVGGALRAGGPSCRLTSHLTMTFHPVAGIDPLNMVRGAGTVA